MRFVKWVHSSCWVIDILIFKILVLFSVWRQVQSMFFLQPLMKGWSMCRKRRLVPSILTSCGRWLRIIRHIWRLVSWRSHVATFWWFVLDGWVSPTSPKCRGYHYCKLWGNIMTCLRYWLWLQEKNAKSISEQNPYFHPKSLWHIFEEHMEKNNKTSPIQNSRQKTQGYADVRQWSPQLAPLALISPPWSWT